MANVTQGEAIAEKAPEKIDDVTAMRRAMTRLVIAASGLSDDVREKIEDARDAAEEAVSALSAEAEERSFDAYEAKSELQKLKEFAASWDGADDRLIRVYRDIEAGRTGDALYALDEVLSSVDSAWRTRA